MCIRDSISIILIIPKNQDQLPACLEYLEKNNQPITHNSPNLHLINQNDEGVKIDQVRQLLEKANYGAYGGGQQFFIILKAEQSSLEAQNALLKILEEPTANTKIVLATSHPQQLLPTIRSRCQAIHFPQVEEGRGEVRQIDKTSPSADTQQWRDLANTLTQESSFSIKKALELAEQYKNRDEALQMCEGVLQQLNSTSFSTSLDQKSSLATRKRTTLVSQHLLKAYQDLQNNLNPQLALEHHLFSLVEED